MARGFPKGTKFSKLHKKRMSAAHKGKRSGMWRGGRIVTPQGYVKIQEGGVGSEYVFEHRYVMEKKIGRKLLPTEAVHHINAIKGDNRIENLVVLTKSENTKEHHRRVRLALAEYSLKHTS